MKSHLFGVTEDQLLYIAELIISQGFCPLLFFSVWRPESKFALRFATDPNLGGVEKLSVSKPCPGMMVGVPSLSVTDVVDDETSQGIIPPLGVLFVKGWTRGMAALAVMACAYADPEFLKARIACTCHMFSCLFVFSKFSV